MPTLPWRVPFAAPRREGGRQEDDHRQEDGEEGHEEGDEEEGRQDRRPEEGRQASRREEVRSQADHRSEEDGRLRIVSGRVALVTGASRGIGRAVALELGRAGLRLALSSRSTEGLEETASLVKEGGGEAVALSCDLSDRAQSAALVGRAAEALAPPDVLVHVAGVAPSAKIAEHDDESWDLAMELNATAAFVLARAMLAHVTAQGWGRLVMVASTAGRIGYPYTAAYTASKHALVGLTRALAVEVAKTGVTVNAACPGFTNTAIVDDAVRNISQRTGVTEDEARRRLASMSPQGRLIEPVEVAKLVRYLVSEEAGGLNGQAINIDGGAVTS